MKRPINERVRAKIAEAAKAADAGSKKWERTIAAICRKAKKL